MKVPRRDKKTRGRPREFDANKALDRGMRVFWRKGFLGASLTDLTRAMRISRPSLYAAFGDKEHLFRKALERYFEGPSSYARESLEAATARAVVEKILRGAINMLTGPGSPATCMWVRCALSSGDGRLREEFAAQRAEGHALLRKRFDSAVEAGDLPAGSDTNALAHLVLTVNYGLTVQATTGATRKDLERVADAVLSDWPGG
ncbi:MAG TPA: TetR/AcrR family transcriptional regulator [Polyangiaceae bacterium]|nr:TetR/AcrR family transcriptional regulator [Polyangiaceae bacterium]